MKRANNDAPPRAVVDALAHALCDAVCQPTWRDAARFVLAQPDVLPALRAWLCPDATAHAMDAARELARRTERPVRRPKRMRDMRLGAVFAPEATE